MVTKHQHCQKHGHSWIKLSKKAKNRLGFYSGDQPTNWRECSHCGGTRCFKKEELKTLLEPVE